MADRNDGLRQIIDEALEAMAAEAGGGFDSQRCNLAEFFRMTGISRQRAGTLRKHGFRVQPHGRTGKRAARTVVSGFAGVVGDLLRKGVTNSQVIFERIRAQGYEGGRTTVKTYVAAHRGLVPPRRRTVDPQGNRGRRYETGPGEAYQMDWGFVNVEDREGNPCRVACFAMVCHHCGTPYVEFFLNARQENLFIGMLHAFAALGIPDQVPADNMKSVVTRRDADGRPVWNTEYAAFMGCVGFRTRLCKRSG